MLIMGHSYDFKNANKWLTFLVIYLIQFLINFYEIMENNQGRIQDLSEGGQDFLGTKKNNN